MSKYISLEKWPEVTVNYCGRPPSSEDMAEFFGIMNLCFDISKKKGERFLWIFKFPDNKTPMAPVFSIRFIAWLVSNKANLSSHLEKTVIYLHNPSWKKWIDFILQNYTPVRPVEVKKL